MRARQPSGPLPIKEVEIGESVSHLLEEARMLIPGVQTLFGFQVVIVFSQQFGMLLSAGERLWHLTAITCSILTLVLLLTPAMLHRERESGWATQGFVNVSTKLMATASVPLALGLAIDFGLVTRLITESPAAAIASSLVTLAIVFGLWNVLPRSDPLLARLRR